MSTKKGTRHVKQLLAELQRLDRAASKAYYEMGQLLSAFEHGELYLVVGYESLDDMIEEELTISAPRGRTYMSLFRKFKELGYTKTYALELLAEFGIRKMVPYLYTAKTRVGIRTVRARIKEWEENHVQVNFTLNASQHAKAMRVLKDFGLEEQGERRQNVRDAFMNMVDYSAGADKTSAKLRLVAGGRK